MTKRKAKNMTDLTSSVAYTACCCAMAGRRSARDVYLLLDGY